MRIMCLALAFLIQAAVLTAGYNWRQRPVPPGIREADKQTNAPIEGPLPPNPKQINPKQLQAEAAELAQLSSGIPQRIENVNQGQMPKDLNDQLKRIEKLAKHIRGEIYP